jgi:hypothetical protein
MINAMAEPLSYEPLPLKGEAVARSFNRALLMAIGAVCCVVLACFGNGLAQRYQDHTFEQLDYLWLPSVALMLRAIELSVRGVRAVGLNRRIAITFILCAAHVMIFVVWVRYFASGGK